MNVSKNMAGDFSFAADAVSVHFYMISFGFSFLKLVPWEFLMSSGKFC